MIFHINPSSGVPLYLQLIEQVKHAVETGALRPGDQLPTIRQLSEQVVMNPNTVVRAYRQLDQEGIIEMRHGSGAFVSSAAPGPRVSRKAQTLVGSMIDRLMALGLTESEIRRAVESELASRAQHSNEEKK